MRSPIQTIKIIGIGSPFGDDRLAWIVIDHLKKKQLDKHIKNHLILESHDRPGAYLVELMRGSDKVIIIDAVKSNAAVGTLHYFRNEQIDIMNNHLSTHSFGVGHALQLARSLGDLPQEVIFCGLEIDDTNKDDSLSETVQKNIHHLIARVISSV